MVSEFALEASRIVFSMNGTRLLDGLDMVLAGGKLSALIGANGSGKSTLLRLLCGLEQPDSGTIKLNGIELKSMPRLALARRIAYVAQGAPVIFPFSALEVVLTGRNPHLGRFGMETAEDLRLALDALEQVGMAHLAQRPVTVLSGGERQLVFVARAIASQPDLMLLDEPASFLDLKHRAQLIRVLRQLKQECGISSLVVTHDLMFLEPSFDEVLALGGGRIIAKGCPSEVLRAETLKEVYSVPIQTLYEEGKIFVWSEV
jgi:iron complex transport system ATP-binding protein